MKPSLVSVFSAELKWLEWKDPVQVRVANHMDVWAIVVTARCRACRISGAGKVEMRYALEDCPLELEVERFREIARAASSELALALLKKGCVHAPRPFPSVRWGLSEYGVGL